MLEAKDVVKKPEIIDEIEGYYKLIIEHTLAKTMKTINKAINLMSQRGWRCVNVSITTQAGALAGLSYTVLALMEKGHQ